MQYPQSMSESVDYSSSDLCSLCLLSAQRIVSNLHLHFVVHHVPDGESLLAWRELRGSVVLAWTW